MGKLSSDYADVESFDATLTFAYSAVARLRLRAWVGAPDGVAALPCSISYELDRNAPTEAPDSAE